MTNNPKVSVLIPSFNYANYIQEAIDSILAQTFQDFELIVLDNASTDNTKEIVEKYIEKDSRIRLIVNDVNIGMYRNYNKALLIANGEYIKFVNADDKLHEKCLEIFVRILDTQQEVSVVSSHRQCFGKQDDILKAKHIGLIPREKAIIESLKYSNWIGEPTTVMFRRKNIYSGLFDVSILMFADLDMWLRQLEHGDLFIYDEVLSYFRIHDSQGTVYLNENKDKALFNSLQYSQYLVNALLFNRFCVDLFDKYPSDYKKVVSKNYKKTTKNIWKTKYWKNKFFFIKPTSMLVGYFEGFLKKLVGYYKW
ncbi:glycosyltransferase family 2 protein [Arcobacter sp. FWKO B]|uniref:glycosyltransferase family 2 protein n=1 Tax=Arcobacter sp. FWKO B TaxID=2593672 RepID=UPI0018A5B6C6|nr:glycosyltransferase [Arcobacter sp. FWKO B]QOG11500.1 glycosyltransferase [Arcobacter sp. FWKO B]